MQLCLILMPHLEWIPMKFYPYFSLFALICALVIQTACFPPWLRHMQKIHMIRVPSLREGPSLLASVWGSILICIWLIFFLSQGFTIYLQYIFCWNVDHQFLSSFFIDSVAVKAYRLQSLCSLHYVKWVCSRSPASWALLVPINVAISLSLHGF